VPPKFVIFIFLVTCQFDWPIAQKNEIMETPQNRRLYFEVYSSSTLAHLYKWKEDTIFQGIWDKSEMVWITRWGKTLWNWGTYWEPIGNLKEHTANTLGSRGIWKTSPPPLPKHKREKNKAPWVHAWAFPLTAWNFSSQKTWSPFLAWANNPCKEHPTYSVLGQSWFLKKSIAQFFKHFRSRELLVLDISKP